MSESSLESNCCSHHYFGGSASQSCVESLWTSREQGMSWLPLPPPLCQLGIQENCTFCDMLMWPEKTSVLTAARVPSCGLLISPSAADKWGNAECWSVRKALKIAFRFKKFIVRNPVLIFL